MVGWSSARELVMVALFAKCRTIAGENRARSSTFCKHAEEMALTGKKWLGDLDSNQDSQIQNRNILVQNPCKRRDFYAPGPMLAPFSPPDRDPRGSLLADGYSRPR